MIKTEDIEAELALQAKEGITGDTPKQCPYRGEADWWTACILDKCMKYDKATGKCSRQ